jgi:hypothetical protein
MSPATEAPPGRHCGSRLAKKIATFGLPRSVIRPCRKAAHAVAKRGGWPERVDQRSPPSCGRAANPPGRVPVACSRSRREGAPPSLRSGPSGDCRARAEAGQVGDRAGLGTAHLERPFLRNGRSRFFVEIFLLRKRIHARVFSADLFRLQIAGLTHAWQRQRSDRGNEPRAGARSRAYNYATERCERDAERRIRFRPWPNARRLEEGMGLPPHGKFFALQSLENSQNAEGISILPEPAALAAERAARMSKARRAVRVPPTVPVCSTSVHEGSSAGWIASANPLPRRDGEGTFPPCKALKTHKMRKESRFLSGNPILSFPRSSRSPDHPSKPRRKV